MAEFDGALGLNEQPRRGRLSRAADTGNGERRERRRKAEADDEAGSQLAIPAWVKEKYPEREFMHRWFLATPARALWAKQNDWDPIEGVDPIATNDKEGDASSHVLHVKYRDWYESDRAPREDRRKELEKQMLRGKVRAQGEDAGETLSDKHQYEEAAAQNRLS